MRITLYYPSVGLSARVYWHSCFVSNTIKYSFIRQLQSRVSVHNTANFETKTPPFLNLRIQKKRIIKKNIKPLCTKNSLICEHNDKYRLILHSGQVVYKLFMLS